MRASSLVTAASSTAQYGAVGGVAAPLETDVASVRTIGFAERAEGAGPWQPRATTHEPKSPSGPLTPRPLLWARCFRKVVIAMGA